MDNPFNKINETIKREINEMADSVEHRIHVAIVRESVAAGLSRLMTLDPERKERYEAARLAMEG